MHIQCDSLLGSLKLNEIQKMSQFFKFPHQTTKNKKAMHVYTLFLDSAHAEIALYQFLAEYRKTCLKYEEI